MGLPSSRALLGRVLQAVINELRYSHRALLWDLHNASKPFFTQTQKQEPLAVVCNTTAWEVALSLRAFSRYLPISCAVVTGALFQKLSTSHSGCCSHAIRCMHVKALVTVDVEPSFLHGITEAAAKNAGHAGDNSP